MTPPTSLLHPLERARACGIRAWNAGSETGPVMSPPTGIDLSGNH